MMALTIIEMFVIGAWVLISREEIIFSDRVAPKYIFDSARALITLGFASFWM